jgi:hypothetical protein
MDKPLLIAVSVVVLLLGGYLLFQTNNGMQGETQNTPEVRDESTTPPPASQGKINIDVVCEGALAYMTFSDGASADAFVTECKNGEHPEVIERYKAELNLGADVAI